MNEAELQKLVVDHALQLGLRVHHCGDTRRCKGNGWPDLWILGLHGCLLPELKAGSRRTAEQALIGTMLTMAGLGYRLWTPRHWYDGTIKAELQAIA